MNAKKEGRPINSKTNRPRQVDQDREFAIAILRIAYDYEASRLSPDNNLSSNW